MLSTQGTSAYGIFAQSVGGGGGLTGGGSGIVDISLGGLANGSTAGNGGSVTITNAAAIETSGILGGAIVAQSIGGSGGTVTGGSHGILALGGSSGNSGNGGTVTVNSTGQILTTGIDAIGLFAQSVGGGGGYADLSQADPGQSLVGATGSASLAEVGGAGSSGNGGNVAIHVQAAIATTGDYAAGIVAQSVGGGGGTAASQVAAVSADLSGLGGASVSGDGGTVRVDLDASASVVTQGAHASAILAQSIGGGGGYGANAAAAAAWGGDGGAGGNAGAVIVESDAALQTGGDESYGILAQAIGGGGGLGGGGGTLVHAMGGISNGDGNGGDVTVGNDGAIVTAGAYAVGIWAQSVGGGGGLATAAAGDPGSNLLL
jgi:hypothetical protein